jgi:hypothetical protein
MKGTSGSVERELAKPRLDDDRDLIAVAVNSMTNQPGMFDDLIPVPNPWATLAVWAGIALGIWEAAPRCTSRQAR